MVRAVVRTFDSVWLSLILQGCGVDRGIVSYSSLYRVVKFFLLKPTTEREGKVYTQIVFFTSPRRLRRCARDALATEALQGKHI